jgi:hypothetical protein
MNNLVELHNYGGDASTEKLLRGVSPEALHRPRLCAEAPAPFR